MGPKSKRQGKDDFKVDESCVTRNHEKQRVGKIFKLCFKIYDPGQQNDCFRFFFFEVMTIIHIRLRGLDRLNFDPLPVWVLNF